MAMLQPRLRLSAGTAVLLLLLPPAAVGGAVDKANVVFMLMDDWGWGDVGYHQTLLNNGMNLPQTPRIDRLAQEGTAFTHFHTMNPECSPSRASFMTGRSPSDKGVRIHLVIGKHEMNVDKGCADFLDPATPTVTSVLRAAGVATGHFGKWHLGDVPGDAAKGLPAAPPLTAYGIDDSVTYGSNPAVNAYFNVSTGKTNPFGDPWFPANSSRIIVDLGIGFIGKAVAAGRQFYLNLWFHISHAPLNPTPEQLAAFPTSSCPGPNPGGLHQECAVQVYRASQHEADAQVGRMVDWLDAHDLRNRTLVVFSTDNGPEDPHIDMHAVGDPGPFRGRKRSLYEGGTRVPFIVSWPGYVPAGRISTADIASIDWLPTAAAVAGVTVPDAARSALMGRDASPLIFGTADEVPRAVPAMWDYRYDNGLGGFCWHGAPRLAIRDGPLKLLTNADPRFPRTELYNVSDATFEQDNLAGLPAHADAAARLRSTVLAWAETLDPIPATAGPIVADAKHLGCREYTYPTTHAPGTGRGMLPWPLDPWD